MPIRPVIMETHAASLEHIVHNFRFNAVKFSHPGAAVFLDLELTDRAVIISVTDQGHGIHERDRADIFSGKIRSHAARRTAGEPSTGMGRCGTIAGPTTNLRLIFSKTGTSSLPPISATASALVPPRCRPS